MMVLINQQDELSSVLLWLKKYVAIWDLASNNLTFNFILIYGTENFEENPSL